MITHFSGTPSKIITSGRFRSLAWHSLALAMLLIPHSLHSETAAPHVPIPNSRNCTQTLWESDRGLVCHSDRLSKHPGAV